MKVDHPAALARKGQAEIAATVSVGTGALRRDIAYRASTGDETSAPPALVWLGGYRSDMGGTKAEHLSAFARAHDIGFLRFDYSGHGSSGGRFEDGTIGRWTEDALAVLDAAVSGPVVLAASSMGAWIALRLVMDRLAAGDRGRFVGLLLLAPAPDFTHRLMLPQMSEADHLAIARDGVLVRPSSYGSEPDIYTKALFEDAAGNLVMGEPIDTDCPVTIIQGMADAEVPYAHAVELMSLLPHDGVVMTLVRDGDHRLSRPQDLQLIERAVLDLIARYRGGS